MTQHTATSDVGDPLPLEAPQPRFHRPGEDLAAAMECVRCKEQGISVPPGGAPRRLTNSEAKRAKKERKRAQAEARAKPQVKVPADRRRVPRMGPHHAEFFRDLWARTAAERAGTFPDARLLALTFALRGALRGQANFTGQDLRILRLEDAHAALSDLTSPGWLDTTPERVIEADAANPALCDLPSLAGGPWKVGNGVRSRASGWFMRTLAHKKMRKKPNRLRLLAAHLALHAEPGGRIRVPAAEAVDACALSGTGELAELLTWLTEISWIEGLSADGGVVGASLTEVTLPLAYQPLPPPTPPRTVPATTPLDVPVADRARDLVRGREERVARWVDDYRAEHGHGPSWSAVADAFAWPPRQAPDHDVTHEVFRLLAEGGWLTGFGVPFGLRSGRGTPV
ncbi:hypothetical protein A6A08_06795 [Nocardiopsis sp. TSRI0078]|uniref:hypothetical protein n=1 Tax=unclassified Nocardiopsis TaxID=2649073 RepID=UPI00093A5822|nr:hypothetical protein [Nocardiopsis sp. TSRI0078]OKI16973.1 hypothetical protein A6A08_06795 [Nocardiopsis sp. TSRI0078]